MGIQLLHLHLKHFRCFKQLDLDLSGPLVLVEGVNGIGKTSILEALYYACYLRSFRTHIARDLIAFGHHDFFIKLAVQEEAVADHTIQIGFSHAKRLVKVDGQPVTSYKDLISHYKVLGLTEDDLQLVQGGPQGRRTFLDQFLLLTDATYGALMRTYRRVVEQRNALLMQGVPHEDTCRIMSQQLWEKANAVQRMRQRVLDELFREVSIVVQTYFPQFGDIALFYNPKYELLQSFDEFFEVNRTVFLQEKRYKRSLFGSHLDDIGITFRGQLARNFASRGQQKLMVILLKMAQVRQLAGHGYPGIFLLDDFMTDLDQERASILVEALAVLGTQLIFTSPRSGGFFTDRIVAKGGRALRLTP